MSASGSLFQKIYYPLIMMTVATIIEFIVVAVNMPKTLKLIIFIVFTIIKAYYIVGYFMHLKFEHKNLINSVVCPAMFIVVLIAALIYEGGTPHLQIF